MTEAGRVDAGPRFALLASGANFSCEVMQALLHHRCPPELLVLPEYPPALAPPSGLQPMSRSVPDNSLLRLAAGIEIAYAPRSRQAACAELVASLAIEYLLVACWPYLISPCLVNCAAKASLNLHPSLLPLHRGPNPIAQQINHGDSRFGVSLHLLSQQFDRGQIVARKEITSAGEVNHQGLERLCATAGVDLFLEACTRGPAGWKLIAQSN